MGNLFDGIKRIAHHTLERMRSVWLDRVDTPPEGFHKPSIALSKEPIPPNHDDQQFLTTLRQLDSYIEGGAGYAEWEAHFFSMQKTCCTRYGQWLKAKNAAQEYCQEFPQCVEVYLAFIYQYGDGDLKQVSSRTVKEFFMNFLPNKVMVEPAEYRAWLPALRLFYTFLGEKGYLDAPEVIRKLLEKIEPRVLRFINKQV